jgi:hypothetical protein
VLRQQPPGTLLLRSAKRKKRGREEAESAEEVPSDKEEKVRRQLVGRVRIEEEEEKGEKIKECRCAYQCLGRSAARSRLYREAGASIKTVAAVYALESRALYSRRRNKTTAAEKIAVAKGKRQGNNVRVIGSALIEAKENEKVASSWPN